MEFLSWLFFCLSPFALFCSEDGNGLVLCPVFIILGFICMGIGNIGITNIIANIICKVTGRRREYRPPTEEEIAKKYEFWTENYKDCLEENIRNATSVDDRLIASKDQRARDWATTVCRYNNKPIPPDYRQELIARDNGVVTEILIKEQNKNKDRIQIGKYVLMCELQTKYWATKITSENERNCYYPYMTIKDDKYNIKLSDGCTVSDYCVYSIYKKSINEMWESLTEEEKAQAKKWVDEYEEKLIKAAHEYIDENLFRMNEIEIEF